MRPLSGNWRHDTHRSTMKAEDVVRPAAMETIANLISRTARAACWAKDLVALSLVTPMDGCRVERQPEEDFGVHPFTGLPLNELGYDALGNHQGSVPTDPFGLRSD